VNVFAPSWARVSAGTVLWMRILLVQPRVRTPETVKIAPSNDVQEPTGEPTAATDKRGDK